jgi:hypothetical protein
MPGLIFPLAEDFPAAFGNDAVKVMDGIGQTGWRIREMFVWVRIFSRNAAARSITFRAG